MYSHCKSDKVTNESCKVNFSNHHRRWLWGWCLKTTSVVGLLWLKRRFCDRLASRLKSLKHASRGKWWPVIRAAILAGLMRSLSGVLQRRLWSMWSTPYSGCQHPFALRRRVPEAGDEPQSISDFGSEEILASEDIVHQDLDAAESLAE